MRDLLSLRTLPQHRQETQADQMRDALLLRAWLFVPQLTAEHARRLDLRREAAPSHRIPPGDRRLAKQIAGFPGSAYAIRHIAPRMIVTNYLTSLMEFSFNSAGESVLRLRKCSENFFRGVSPSCRVRRRRHSTWTSCSNALTKWPMYLLRCAKQYFGSAIPRCVPGDKPDAGRRVDCWTPNNSGSRLAVERESSLTPSAFV